jgi:hypothetical protein
MKMVTPWVSALPMGALPKLAWADDLVIAEMSQFPFGALIELSPQRSQTNTVWIGHGLGVDLSLNLKVENRENNRFRLTVVKSAIENIKLFGRSKENCPKNGHLFGQSIRPEFF